MHDRACQFFTFFLIFRLFSFFLLSMDELMHYKKFHIDSSTPSHREIEIRKKFGRNSQTLNANAEFLLLLNTFFFLFVVFYTVNWCNDTQQKVSH